MGSFGGGANVQVPQALNDRQTAKSKAISSLYTPFGSLAGRNGEATYQVGSTMGPTVHLYNNSVSGQQGMLNNLNSLSSQTPDQMFGGAGYDSAYHMLSQPLLRQQQNDTQDLNNTLNASNLIGGSYDAYQKDLLARRYQDALSQANDQAHQYAFQSNNQNFQNQVSALAGMGTSANSAYDQLFTPLKYATALGGVNAQSQGNALNYLNSQTQSAISAQNAKAQQQSALLQGTIGMIPTLVGAF